MIGECGSQYNYRTGHDLVVAPTHLLHAEDRSFTYGTLFCGVGLCEEAWPNAAERIFGVDEEYRSDSVQGRRFRDTDHQRFDRMQWDKVLMGGPPDLLVVCQPDEAQLKTAWEKEILDRPERRPPLLLIVDDPETLVTFEGAPYKAWSRRLETWVTIFVHGLVGPQTAEQLCEKAT